MNNLPCFTAECALYSNRNRYVARIRTASNQQVIPQKINNKCWSDRFERTYLRCVSIGYDLEPCIEVAVGLADSVCDF